MFTVMFSGGDIMNGGPVEKKSKQTKKQKTDEFVTLVLR